jgi:uncharacterized membrane protein
VQGIREREKRKEGPEDRGQGVKSRSQETGARIQNNEYRMLNFEVKNKTSTLDLPAVHLSKPGVTSQP